ncbi:hypothetical protein Lsai_2515 [Legionella sainthelensi]|uniref:DUF4917 domain-containing protein n=1 Tax=Legionella sainthelensi TaxID=28087 RepID=A0A0W0YDI5_9GAMM|nr:DUF4917 family protein [Legionella sainthelensi]KTD54923.1 hypothetical protein Lsai_2515 [Legionella sainthelensi]
MEIKQWNEICSKYKDASLILGNGASIAFDAIFDYQSLYEVANQTNLIEGKLLNLFEKFNTENFELVLYRLWQAKEVLNVLDISTEFLDDNYSLCREALISTVHKAHIKYDNENDVFIKKLNQAYKFLMNFKTVFSLNYDLILYWIIAKGNTDSDKKGNIFKDCFWKPLNDFKVFDFDVSFFRKPDQEQDKAVLIFYPHGNLTLARLKQEQFHEIDLKICSRDQVHLEAIFDTWKKGRFEPVFISEGDFNEKRKRILESEYLRTIYKYGFEEIEQKLVIYGWSLSKQDTHLLQRLQNIQDDRKKTGMNIIKSIAVSIYPNGKENEFIEHVNKKLTPLTNDIDFYYSNQDCWCY